MKYRIRLFLIITVVFCWISCKNNEIPFDRDNLIFGNWEFVVSSEEPSYTLYHMKRTSGFSDKYGSTFFGADGKFTFRGAWGCIGQPTMFTGTWVSVNDTLIIVDMVQLFTETWKMVLKKLDRESMDYYYLYDD